MTHARSTKPTAQASAQVSQKLPQAQPRSLSSADTLTLQRQASCACGGGCPRCQSKAILQPKLKIGAVGDRYEQEADRIAEQVMRMQGSSIQRQIEPEEEKMVQRQGVANQITPLVQRQVLPKMEEEVIQTKTIDNQAAPSAPTQESSEVPSIVHKVLSSPGQPLDAVTRAFMESSFGRDFGGVRVHTDQLAARSAEAVAARAYTVGSDVVFGSGRYAPMSRDGQRLLAHELTHVVQQDGARAAGPLSIQDASDPAEQAADFVADRLAQGRSLVPNLGTGSAVLQREGAGSHAGPAGIPSEKWSELSEDTYRRADQTYRADAIRQCRLNGIEFCLRILTEKEAHAAYELAKEGYFPREAASQITRSQQSVQKLARAPSTSTAAPAFTGGKTAVFTGAKEIAKGVIKEIAKGVIKEIAKGVIKRIPVVLLAALFALSLAEEVRISRFIRILEENGFVVLLNPLGVCIGLCHSAPRVRTLPLERPWPEVKPFDWTRVTPKELKDLEKFMQQTEPIPAPRPSPKPPPLRQQPPPPQQRIEPATKTAPTPQPSPKPTVDVIPGPPTQTDTDERRRKRCPPVTLLLPRAKAQDFGAYADLIGQLEHVPGRPRDTDQRNFWRRVMPGRIPAAVWSRAAALGLSHEQVIFPSWSRTARYSESMEVDHLIEMQVTPVGREGSFDTMFYYRLMDASSNGGAGSELMHNILKMREALVACTKDQGWMYRRLRFERIAASTSNNPGIWTKDDLIAGRHLDAYERLP